MSRWWREDEQSSWRTARRVAASNRQEGEMTSTASKNAARNADALAKSQAQPQAEKVATVVANAPRWTTWAGIKKADHFTYLGRTSAKPGRGYSIRRVDHSIGNKEIILRDQAGRIVGQFPPNTKFWAVVPVPTSAEPKATQHTADVRKAAGKAKAPSTPREPKAPKTLHPCHCGCGAQVVHLYKQGHDARHVSQLAAQYKSEWDQAENIDELAKSVLAEVAFSERLTLKLRRSMEIIDDKKHKSQAAKAAAKISK